MSALNNARPWALMAAASVVALSSVTAAQAQTAPAESTGGLQEIVVTARKVKERAQDVPITIAAQTGEQLTQNAIRSVSDLSAITPGLQTMRTTVNAGSGMFILRGFTQSDNIVGLDQPVTVYVDNVFNEGASGLVGTKLYDIERVEVLKGPQGTLFGRNSTGGAVQIYTKAPTDHFEAEVLGGLSQHPEGGARLAGFINMPLGEKAALRITAEYNKEGGYSRVLHTAASDSILSAPPYSGGLNSGWAGGNRSYMVRAGLKLEPTDRLHVMLRAGFNRLDAEALPLHPRGFVVGGAANAEAALDLQGKTLAQGGVLNAATIGAAAAALTAVINSPDDEITINGSANGESVKSYYASGELTYELTDNVSIRSITGWRRLNASQQADVDGGPFTIIPTFSTKRTTEFSEELQVNANLLENRLKLVAGAYYYRINGHEIFKSPTLYLLQGASPSTAEPTLKRTAPAIFGQATVAVLPNLNLTGGLRYTWDRQTMRQQGTKYSDWFVTPIGCAIPDATLPCDITNKVNNQALSWLASVDYKPIPDTMLFFKVARGFKSGGNQARVSPDPTSILPFLPEFVTEYEGGIKSEWFDHRLRFNASYFVDSFTDAQKLVSTFSGGVFSTPIHNVGSAKIQGADVETQFSATKQLTIGGTLGYLKGKYNTYSVPDLATGAPTDVAAGYIVTRLPKWTYTVWANFKQPTDFGFVSANLNWRWVGTQSIGEGRRGPESRPAGIPVTALPIGSSDTLTTQPGYGLLNGRLAVHVDSANLEVSVWGSNLLNKKYNVFANDLVPVGLGYIYDLIGAPRAYGIEVSKRF
jgi:iron complex outermembrane receptor protein